MRWGNAAGWRLLGHDNTHTHKRVGGFQDMMLHIDQRIVLLLPLLLTNSWSLAWMTAAGCAEQGHVRPCQVIWHRGAWEIGASWTRSLKQSPVLLIQVLHIQQHMALSGKNDLVDTKGHEAECAAMRRHALPCAVKTLNPNGGYTITPTHVKNIQNHFIFSVTKQFCHKHVLTSHLLMETCKRQVRRGGVPFARQGDHL